MLKNAEPCGDVTLQGVAASDLAEAIASMMDARDRFGGEPSDLEEQLCAALQEMVTS